MFNDFSKQHYICIRPVLSTHEEFSLKWAHYGYSPLPITEPVFNSSDIRVGAGAGTFCLEPEPEPEPPETPEGGPVAQG